MMRTLVLLTVAVACAGCADTSSGGIPHTKQSVTFDEAWCRNPVIPRTAGGAGTLGGYLDTTNDPIVRGIFGPSRPTQQEVAMALEACRLRLENRKSARG